MISHRLAAISITRLLLLSVYPCDATHVSRRVKFLSSKSASLSAKGSKSFSLNSCEKAPELNDDVLDDPLYMTLEKCFAFCSTSAREPMRYFGITEGRKCWCSALLSGEASGAATCDVPCSGNKEQLCGGHVDVASIYVMFDCSDKAVEDQGEEATEAHRQLLSSYTEFTGQTCGQAAENVLEVDGAGTFVGPAETCMSMCTKGANADKCHGFTYESEVSRCTFHVDVLDGPIVKRDHATCVFKKV